MKERLIIQKGDITQLQLDVIVNAANKTLLGGGGVDGAIHKAAGPELLKECKTLCGCETGQAKLTKGYNLKASWVIHTVGPVWQGGERGERELLQRCYDNSLKIAEKNKFKTIAFPAISTGVYGFPKEDAAKIAITTSCDFLATHTLPEQIVLIFFSDNAYKQALALYQQQRKQGKSLTQR